MSAGRIAAGIDVGTNAVKCVVVRVEGGRIVEVLHEDRRVTRLGEGVHAQRRLHSTAIVRTCEAIAAMAEAARAKGAGESIRAGATSAARDAENREELLRCVRERCGVEVEILPGEEEARLTFLAISVSMPGDTPIAVMDPGGGSTEWILGRSGHIEHRQSLPMGAVRATELYFHNDPPAPEEVECARAGIAHLVASLPEADGRVLIGTGGTLRNMASVHMKDAGLSWEDASKLSRAEVERQAAEYASMPLAERREIPGLEPDRADIILGGALIVAACMDHARAEAVTVTDQGLRHGLALNARD